jgi:hypothetical protein
MTRPPKTGEPPLNEPLRPVGLDPVTMARFLVMPGVADLLDAFSRIPPGPLRDSVISHARVIADQYSGAPAEYAMRDPLLTAAQTAPVDTPLIEAPRQAALPKAFEGPEAEVIRRRKLGQHPQQITAEMGNIQRSVVSKIIYNATKAGVKFPSIRVAKGRPMERKEFVTDPNQLTGQGLAMVERAAASRGLNVTEYFRRKALTVELAKAGEHYPAIMQKTGMDRKTVSLWLSNARASGQDIPYVPSSHHDLREPEPQAEDPASNVVQVSRFFGPISAVSTRHLPMIQKAAERRQMTTEAYLDLQESVVRQRMAGVGGGEIAERTGQTEIFVKDTLAAAKQRGAVFPKLTERRPWGSNRLAQG